MDRPVIVVVAAHCRWQKSVGDHCSGGICQSTPSVARASCVLVNNMFMPYYFRVAMNAIVPLPEMVYKTQLLPSSRKHSNGGEFGVWEPTTPAPSLFFSRSRTSSTSAPKSVHVCRQRTVWKFATSWPSRCHSTDRACLSRRQYLLGLNCCGWGVGHRWILLQTAFLDGFVGSISQDVVKCPSRKWSQRTRRRLTTCWWNSVENCSSLRRARPNPVPSIHRSAAWPPFASHLTMSVARVWPPKRASNLRLLCCRMKNRMWMWLQKMTTYFHCVIFLSICCGVHCLQGN